MKKLIALIAVLGFVPYAHAADGAEFSHSGEFRVQYQNNMNADMSDDGADSPDQVWHQRLKVGTQVRAGEKMMVNFSFLHNANWGMNSDQVPDTGSGATADATGSRTENMLTVYEAYMTWMATDAWTFKFGRGTATMADGRFVSANDFWNVPYAFEGGVAVWNTDFALLSFSATRGADFKSSGLAGAQNNEGGHTYGIAADLKGLPTFLKTANVHVFQRKVDEVDVVAGAPSEVSKQNNLKIGTSLTGEVSALDWRLNYEMEQGENENYGTKTDIKTSMIDAEVGYSMASMMNSRFHFGYHTDSGTKSGTDDETYDGYYYDRHNNAGLMDIFGWGNLTYMRFGLKMSPTDDITVGAEYFMFSQTEKEDDSYTAAAEQTAVTGTSDPNEDDLGTELDVWATKKYTNNFNITARYSMFMPGDEFKSSNMEDTYSQIYLESKLTF